MKTNNNYKIIKSPIGKLTLVADDQNLLAVLWPGEGTQRTKINLGKLNLKNPIILKTELQLGEYFSGDRQIFDLPIKLSGTDFQKKVWNALRKIPYGKTSSYGQLAANIGSPKASRAAGAANGKNPISVIVPCHRVIGKNGALTGFAGGLNTKLFLLDLERKTP